jgi:hypothetical protein
VPSDHGSFDGSHADREAEAECGGDDREHLRVLRPARLLRCGEL